MSGSRLGNAVVLVRVLTGPQARGEELIRDWRLFRESGELLAANMTQMFVSHKGYEMLLNAFENKEPNGCLITALLTPRFATV